MSNSMHEQSKFAQYIAQALNEYLLNVPRGTLTGDEIYKFSMKIWFDIDDKKVKAIHVDDIKFAELNKSLNKKYRKVVNE